MAVPIIGQSGVVADVDEARNIQVYQAIPGYPAAGGFYSVSGHTTAVVAAALAADVLLMAARLATGSTRKAYVTSFRLNMWAVTANAAAVDQGILGLRKFSAVTPTGGNARTAARLGPTKGTVTDMTDIRDLNAALTGAPTFGTDGILGQTPVPVIQGAVAAGLASVAAVETLFVFDAPAELSPGEGIALRTIKACPATATWGYSYTMFWFER